MYVILPGKPGYAGSWKLLDAARKVISEARRLREELDASVIEAIETMAETTELTPKEIISKLSSEHCKTYDKYVKSSEELFSFYRKHSNRSFDEADEEIFGWFSILLVSDENFYDIVEDYFKNVNDIFNELVQSSSDQKLRVRGMDVLLALYFAMWSTAKELNRIPCAIYDTMNDLLVE